MRDLLVLGCSSQKTSAPEATPALYRYDGPFYQDFRKHLRERVWPRQLDVAVLSAKFGLIGMLTEIEDYDQRMTPERAAVLAPEISNRVSEWTKSYSRIKLCLGRDYLPALPMEWLARWGRAEVFGGPIGMKRQHMGAFLRSLEASQRPVARPGPSSRLSYFLPDWDDLLDPAFSFENDCFSGPKATRGEKHCARLMRPYKIADGILVSLAQKRESKGPLKYVGGLDTRTLRPIDLREHYALDRTQALFGDCGAFSYVNEDEPPFSVAYAVGLYDVYNFDYGASVDHIPVREIIVKGKRKALSLADRKKRVQMTIDNADAFFAEARRRGAGFVPVGTVQGLSAGQFANTACAYAEMGYRRIALGGLVPLADDAVKGIVAATMKALRQRKRSPEVHLFGVFRPKLQGFFRQVGVTSFDSATYFRKAWLRSDQNYLAADGQWYGAIRVPMTEDGRTKKHLLETGNSLARLHLLEATALAALHDYGRHKLTLKATLEAVMSYDKQLTRVSEDSGEHYARYERTLRRRPWERCPCPICRKTGIDVLIFRGSNRNKRRGAHNTWRLYSMIKENDLSDPMAIEVDDVA